MPFTPDELRDLPYIISTPRFATYLQASANDCERAIALYEWNLALSSAFIIPLQICEVAMCNAVAEAIKKIHGTRWPWSNGFLRSLPRPKRPIDYNPEYDLRSVAARLTTTGKIVAEVKFAFWENIFTAGQDSRISNAHFNASFPSAPTESGITTLRTKAYEDLRIVRRLRNRIAHHEPIFARDTAADYAILRELIAWRSPVAARWVDQKQSVLSLIAIKP